MSQSKTMSWVETCTSTAIGYVMAVTTQTIIFPWFGIHVPLHDNLMMGAVFTVVSIVRGYLIRRTFNTLRG